MKPLHAVCIFAVLALAFRLASVVGLTASDDLTYSLFAEAIRDGRFEPTAHHYAFRYALNLPVAAVYAVFGVSEWSMIAVPLLCSTLSVPLLWSIANQLYGAKVAWAAAGLYATFPLSLHYGSILVPESVACFYALVGVRLYLHAMSKGSLSTAAAAGLLFGMGVLAKESAAFLGLAFGCAALAARRWQVACGLALGVAVVAAAELIYHATVSGDPLLRVHSMGLHEASPMAVAANEDLGYRLLKAYPRMMLVPSLKFGVHSLLAVTIGALGWLCWSAPHRAILLLWVVLPWAYLNWGTSSFDRYYALPVGPRYLEFTYPPLFVLAALAGVKVTERLRWTARPLLVALAAVGVSGVVCGVASRGFEPRNGLVAELRAAASDARHRGVGAAVVTQSRESVTSQVVDRWRRAFRVLAPDIELVDDPSQAGVVIHVDEESVVAQWR